MMKQNALLLAGMLIIILVLMSPVTADTIEVNEGNDQSAVVNTAVTTPPSVRVMNGTIPVSGISVTFAVTNGGGSITDPTAITGSDGIATVGSWTLGTLAGSNSLIATSGSLSGSPVTFTATGTAGPATQIALYAGNGQSAPVNTVVTTRPSVIVKDEFDNPKSGVSVIFAIASGGGNITGGSAITGSDGIATIGSWQLGPTAGTNMLTATSGSLTGSPYTFTATGTASTTAPIVSSISPNHGYNSSTIYDVTISGTGFSTSEGLVVLTKTGETNITGACSRSATTLTCSFPLTGNVAGTWNVVVRNADGQEGSLANGFTINSASSAPTLTSIEPTSAETNTTVSITSLVGTNFNSAAKIRLRRSSYNDIFGSVSSVNSAGTVIAGTFNLNNQAPGNYEVCVYNDESTFICDLTFRITDRYAGTNSSIYFESNPSEATVYLNKTRIGTTVFTYHNATPGTYTVLLQKTGYRDYTGTVTVLEGKRTTFYARLTSRDEVTTVTTTAATATPVKTATTIKKSTVKVPTTWPSATPTQESPVDPAIVIGAAAIGIGLVALKRR